MEIESDKINFNELYRITKIELDTVTFKKYMINRNPTLGYYIGSESVELGKEIGEEIHKCKPELIAELAGNVGMIIKGFEVTLNGKSKKKVVVSKIIKLDEFKE